MKYIIEGIDVPKVLRENRVRISRGTLKVTPVTDEAVAAAEDLKEPKVEDSKDVTPEADNKSPKKGKK